MYLQAVAAQRTYVQQRAAYELTGYCGERRALYLHSERENKQRIERTVKHYAGDKASH